jgi:peroxiredoxin Q/BCP
MLSPGDIAPDFELLNSKQERVKLSDNRGKRVIVYFYPKAGTSSCTTQARGFRDNFDRIEASNGIVMAISPDEPEALAQWKKKEKLPFLLLSDPDHRVAELYGVWGEKMMFGRTVVGILRSHFVIDSDGKIEDAQVRVTAKNSVSKALDTVEG